MATREPSYAPATVWDAYFQDRTAAGNELNPQGWWVPAFWPQLGAHQAQTLLDLGCGMGGDALSLAHDGVQVTGVDYSAVAVARARAKAEAAGLPITFLHADMAEPLPFAAASFDAVMSNVALHSFPDRLTRQIVGEITRVVKPGGLLLLHVNSTQGMPYRAAYRERVRELEPNFYLEAHGQTMRFFSEEYLRAVLAAWDLLELTHVPLQDAAGQTFKCVWRCVARKPSATR